MAFSKVTLNGVTLMDVTQDTVTENDMLFGVTATAANGTTITGTVVTTPVDSALDTTSENAIQNKPVALALESKVEVNAYAVTLAVANWSNTTPSTYIYSNSNIKCGKSGNVPPLITCTSNEIEYSKITSANATPSSGIIFSAPTAPTNAISIVIVDFS